MKIPRTPPPIDSLWSPQIQASLFSKWIDLAPTVQGRYLHWDRLGYYAAGHRPEGLTTELWWLGIKLARRGMSRTVPLLDKAGAPFHLALVDPLPELLRRIDMQAGGTIAMPFPVANPETKREYLIRSRIEEAFTSSQLEGAATTRQRAKEMIRKGQRPSSRGERMVLNNYRAMEHILALRDASLTPEVVLDLHRIVAEETLDDPSAAGRLRRGDEDITVADATGTVTYHVPPPARELEARLQALCVFANGGPPEGPFLHPAIRAMIVHFWLAYDHPFVDGNGRTARALFYWVMLRSGYWLFEYVSISNMILKSPARYGRAFLETETDENDLTYFLLFHAEVIDRALDSLHDYLGRKAGEMKEVEQWIRSDGRLNHRQRSALAAAFQDPDATMTVESHARTHGVVLQTARTDLLGLVKRGYFRMEKVGRAHEFRPAPELLERSGRNGS